MQLRPAITTTKKMSSHWVCKFYNRALKNTELKIYHQDITLVTLSTADRIHNIGLLVEQWSGLLNMAFFVRNASDLAVLDSMLESYSGFRKRANVHLVWEEPQEPFPINMLRNIAEIGVETTHVFHVDIDFVQSKDFRETLLVKHGHLLHKSMTEPMIIVVPSFELVPSGSRYPRCTNDTGGLAGVTLPYSEKEHTTTASFEKNSDSYIMAILNDLSDKEEEDTGTSEDVLEDLVAKDTYNDNDDGKVDNGMKDVYHGIKRRSDDASDNMVNHNVIRRHSDNADDDAMVVNYRGVGQQEKRHHGEMRQLQHNHVDGVNQHGSTHQKQHQLQNHHLTQKRTRVKPQKPPGPGFKSVAGKWKTRRTYFTNELRAPLVKADVEYMLYNYELRQFHARCRFCQEETDLARWLKSSDVYYLKREPQMVSEIYEPFSIIPTGSIIWNENFSGYGRDKTLYYYELRVLRRYRTVVLPDTFIVHKEHAISDDAAKFREKYSLRYRYDRLKKYDKEMDFLDQMYAKKHMLPVGHDIIVNLRRKERFTRDVLIEKSLMKIAKVAKGGTDRIDSGATHSFISFVCGGYSVVFIIVIIALFIYVHMKRRYRRKDL